jgi:DNA-binding transcriptional LysR family regulator
MRLDLDSVQTLAVVVEEGGFARAAEKLHKAQSAVSYQIKKLEDALGLQLLDRSGYRVALTAEGQVLLAEGHRLLAQARNMETLALRLREAWEPRLTLVIDGILPLEPIMLALKKMADENVPTRIQVKVEFLHGVQYRFNKDQADLMLVKDAELQPYLIAEDLPEIECVLCVSPQHPLALLPEVDLWTLQQHVELSVQDSSERGDDNLMFGGERVFYLSGFIAKKSALLMGLGFGWMPTFLVADEIAEGRLKEVIYHGGSRYKFTPKMVHRMDKPLGRAGKMLAAVLRQTVEQTAGKTTI